MSGDAEGLRRRQLTVEREGRPFTLHGIEFGDPERRLDLLFLHGNGFNALVYRQALAPLAPELRILSLDLRGHGRTPADAEPEGRLDHRDMRDDVIALIETLDEIPRAVAGHSLGGCVALMVAAERPDLTRELVLFDPAIMSREDSASVRDGTYAPHPMVEGTRRRRRIFADRDEAFANFTGRGAFKGWSDAVLGDFVTDALRDRADGQVELACSPDWEVSNYKAYGHFDLWEDMTRIVAPMSTLRAEQYSTCPYRDASEFPGRSTVVDVRTAPGTNHFFPMAQPALVTDMINDKLAR